jgi:MFS family permease
MNEATASIADAEPAPRRWFNRTVIGAGVTSAFGDLAYETTNVIIPGFLAALGAPAACLGMIEGIADAVASFTKLAAGYISDRLGLRKTLVVAGYGLTPVGQALIALAAGWPLILLGRVVSWFGKGLRGPLRDTIIAESIAADARGRAFGFHRAMDTVGAVAGPMLGVALLGWAQTWSSPDPRSAFRFVFWLTLIPGLLSVLSFGLLVKDDRTLPNKVVRFWSSLHAFPPAFRRFLVAVGVFGVGDFSHALLILGATQLLAPEMGAVKATQAAGLLYVVRNLTQTVGSYPIGALADCLGHRAVLLAGYALGALTAALMVVAFMSGSSPLPLLAAVFVVAGVYVAVQEALEPSLVAEFAAESIRSTAYGVLGAINGAGKLLSSVTVGVLWTTVSPAAAFGLASAIMAVGTLALAGASTVRRPRL